MHGPQTQTGPPSPLVAIKQKELELAAELSLAQQAAERDVEAARQWAGSFVRQLEREAHQAVELGGRAALETAAEQASAIRDGGERAAAALLKTGTPHIAEAAERIVALVLPQVHANAATPAPSQAQVDHA